MKALLPLLAALALAQPAESRAASLLDAPLSFSATRQVTVDGKPYAGMMFHVPGQERHEQNLMGLDEVFILDDKAAEGYLVLPSMKTLIEFPFPALFAALLDAKLAAAALGEEEVGRTPTTKYRFDKTAPDGTHGEGFLWISKRGVLMKLDGQMTAPGGHKTRIAMSLSGFKEAPQSPALFQPPKGFTTLPAAALAPLLGLARGVEKSR